MRVKGAEVGTCPRPHLHPHLHLWHRHGVAGVAGGPGACGHPASQETRGQSRAAQPGRSGAVGPVTAGRSPRTGDARARGSGRRGGAGSAGAAGVSVSSLRAHERRSPRPTRAPGAAGPGTAPPPAALPLQRGQAREPSPGDLLPLRISDLGGGEAAG